MLNDSLLHLQNNLGLNGNVAHICTGLYDALNGWMDQKIGVKHTSNDVYGEDNEIRCWD
jgi:hypothetical protein